MMEWARHGMSDFSHFIWHQPLPNHGLDTRAWWSCEPGGQALVFVHGFGGRPLATWSQFTSLLARQPSCAHHDIFFFGYDGKHTEVVASAGQFRDFLNDLMASPKDMYLRSGAAAAGRAKHHRTYSKVVVVGHSLGAVVARRALLDAYNDSTHRRWARKVNLLFFAPAHVGAKLFSLVQLSPLGVALSVVPLAQLAGKYLALDDLKEGSRALQDLKDDLRREFGVGKPNLKAIRVVHAINDPIVRNATLFPDPAPQRESGCNHLSVCKPNDRYLRPIVHVTESL